MFLTRYTAGLQSYTCHPLIGRFSLRNHIDMGSITLPTGIPVSSQADPATNTYLPLLECDSLCIDGELPTIQQRDPALPWQQWC